MKKAIVFVLFILFATVSQGQKKYQDVVYLKNGSIIRGRIVEQVPLKSLSIQTSEQNVFIYSFDEIEKFVNEPLKSKPTSSTNHKVKKRGYIFGLDHGYIIDINNSVLNRTKFNIINGYRFNPYLSLGVGVGIHHIPDMESSSIPVYIDMRINLSEGAISPYISLTNGIYELSDKEMGPKNYFSPSIGVSYRTPHKFAVNLGIGYESINLKIRIDDDYHYSDFQLRGISITSGITF